MSQRLPVDPPPSSSGSDPAPDAELTCEVCGRVCKSKLGLAAHLRSHERQAPGETPEIKVKPAPAIGQAELAEIQKELAENVKTVGQLLRPVFLFLKVAKLQDPQARLRVPGTRIDLPLPEFDTHLSWTLISRSELTAKVLCEHAAENETLLRWLVRFNGWFKGGEVGSLIGSHLVAAAASVGVQPGVVQTIEAALIPDVLEQVRSENYQLRQQLAEAQARLQTVGGDGRGAGN